MLCLLAMEAKSARIQLTARDMELLTILARGPLTIEQLLRHSIRLTVPYGKYEAIRRRLALLSGARLISARKYHIPAAVHMNYYKLTRAGYRLVFPDAPLPSHSYFDPVKFANQNHTFALHEFMSRLDRDAHQGGFDLVNFRRDREIQLTLGEEALLPDGYFQLVGNGQTLNYYLEIDCGTEPVISYKNRESLIRKIRFYDDFALQSDARFRVLTVFTSGPVRYSNFLDTVREYISPPYNRTVFLATMLDSDGIQSNVVREAVFQDHRRRHLRLTHDRMRPKPPTKSHAELMALAVNG